MVSRLFVLFHLGDLRGGWGWEGGEGGEGRRGEYSLLFSSLRNGTRRDDEKIGEGMFSRLFVCCCCCLFYLGGVLGG